MSNITHVNENNFEQEVLKSEKPVLIDFWAEWCGPCKMVSPIVDEFATENSNFKVVKIDIEENQKIAMDYKIRSIPTLMIFDKGEIKSVKIGAISKNQLNAFIESI